MSYEQTFKEAHTARRERLGYPCAPKQPFVDLGAYLKPQMPIEPEPTPEPVEIDPALLFAYFAAHVDVPFVEPPRITGKEIVEEVAAKHGVSVLDLKSNRRFKALVPARREAVFRMKTETLLSYPQMGRLLNRDHTTMLYHYRKQCELLERGEVV